MRMNRLMLKLLAANGIRLPLAENDAAGRTEPPTLATFEGSVLLQSQMKEATLRQKPHLFDATGFEAFVNHVHFKLTDGRESLLRCLRYAAEASRNSPQLHASAFVAALECR
jgi:hypothetical protein